MADLKKHPTKVKKRILVVDDAAPMTNLWRAMLENAGGYIVREENQSRRAVAVTRAFRPDLLLLDINMPGLDGTDVARLVRSDVDLDRTVIVFVSSLITSDETAAGRRVDGHRCLPKPIGIVDLVQAIESTLALSC